MAENRERNSERITPEQREAERQRRLDRKLARAQRDDIGVISKKTLDSSDFIFLIGTTDLMLNLIRRNMGRKGKIDILKAARYLTEVERIKEELNLLNAEMCRELGEEYRPPYGYENPLVEEIRTADGIMDGEPKEEIR
jgi:hypothetical protein